MKQLLLFVLALALAACGAPGEAFEVTREVEVTRNVYITQEVVVSQQVEVTRLVKVTVVVTPAGPTPTPAPTRTPVPTQDITRSPKGVGSYLAGTEIALGVWRSTRITDDYLSGECYIKTENFSGDLEDNSLNPLGATFRVPSGQFIVIVDNCVWEFLQP